MSDNVLSLCFAARPSLQGLRQGRQLPRRTAWSCDESLLRSAGTARLLSSLERDVHAGYDEDG